jgi:hypothetical protein
MRRVRGALGDAAPQGGLATRGDPPRGVGAAYGRVENYENLRRLRSVGTNRHN